MNIKISFWLTFLCLTLNTNSWSQEKIFTQDEYSNLIKSLKEARESKNNTDLAETYYKLAVYEDEVNKNNDLAFDYYISSKQYYSRENDAAQISKINKVIAKRYAELGFTAEAINIYKNLIDYYKENKDEKSVAFLLKDLSVVYRESGDAEKAMIYLNQSLRINRMLKDTNLIVDLNFEKITNYLKLGERDSALIITANCVDLTTKLSDKVRLSKSLYFIGFINALKRDYDKSVKYLLSALAIYPDGKYDNNRREVYKALASSYAAKQMHKEAYIYSLKYNGLNDSILNHERKASVSDLSIKYQADQKEKDIRFLEIENKSVLQKIFFTRSALYFVAIGCLLLLIALYYVIRFYNQKIRVEKIINEQQHEIDVQKIRELEDNIKISSMQSMIVGQEKERERIATDLHDSLGGLLSAIKLQFDHVKTKLNGYVNLDQYHKATNLLDTAVEEVRNISRNLQPGALKDLGLVSAINDLVSRFEGESYPEIFFQYYNIDEKLDEMTSLSIYRIVQELINNTIKHAHAKEILIQITKEAKEIVIEYEDDGNGIDLSKVKRKGMGLENINSRVNYLKGSISVNSKFNEGVSYLIRIPHVEVGHAS